MNRFFVMMVWIFIGVFAGGLLSACFEDTGTNTNLSTPPSVTIPATTHTSPPNQPADAATVQQTNTPTPTNALTSTQQASTGGTITNSEAISPAVQGQAAISGTEAISANVHLPIAPVSAAETVTNSLHCTIPLHLDFMGYPDKANLFSSLGCPVSEASSPPIAINEFGAGPDYKRFMLWFSNEGKIDILFEDQSWLAYTDEWQEGQPEITCVLPNRPQTSPPLPRRGFGKLWCTVDSVRERMGEIDREERLCQHSVLQSFEKGKMVACFEDATIRYFRILDTGVWDVYWLR